MNDLEWDSSTDPVAMLLFVAEYEQMANISRKLRLCAAGCCRLAWSHLFDWRSREAVEAVEHLASGPVLLRRLRELSEAAADVWSTRQHHPSWWWEEPQIIGQRIVRAGLTAVELAAARAASNCANSTNPVAAATTTIEVLLPLIPSETFAHIVREVFGNPFHVPEWNRQWRTSTVLDLARQVESDQAYHLLPILSDALMDAGCEDERIMAHCRQTEGHSRGCWVVDWVLQRK
jgi:hypothetical protein